MKFVKNDFKSFLNSIGHSGAHDEWIKICKEFMAGKQGTFATKKWECLAGKRSDTFSIRPIKDDDDSSSDEDDDLNEQQQDEGTSSNDPKEPIPPPHALQPDPTDSTTTSIPIQPPAPIVSANAPDPTNAAPPASDEEKKSDDNVQAPAST